jgi:hypothetical protein
MSRKCIAKELYESVEHSHYQDKYDDNDILSLEGFSEDRKDFLQLGELILQTQDGNIKKSDFHKLENWLLTDSHALKYYVEFMWLCAGLHTLLNEKRLLAITESLRSLQPQ